jgi:hypothetical protein
MKRGLGAVVIVALIVGAGVPASATEPADAPRVEANGRPLREIVAEMALVCASPTTTDVALVLTDGVRFSSCASIRNRRLGEVARELAGSLAWRNLASVKVARYAELAHLLPRSARWDRVEATWGLAAGDPRTCRLTRRETREELRLGREAGETVTEWTLTEAVVIAATCPRRLPILIRRVEDFGHPKAAADVDRRVRRAARAANISLAGVPGPKQRAPATPPAQPRR